MNLLYKSTRNSDKTVTASQAILKGLADDGGLFVPVSVPKLDVTMDELKDMSYQETAYAVMKQFFTDLTEEELAVYKRGRNAHSPTMAKHATMADYRRATGFEALMGYLYLKEDYSRIVELVRKGIPEENL